MFNHVAMKALPELECETLPTGRTYITPEGNKYPSITTVLGNLSKAGILAWRKRVGEEVANKISTQAATRGTAVHTLAEDYINNKEDWSKGAMPANIFSFNQIKTILDERLDNVWAQEVPLYSDKFKIAGRVDCIAEYNGKLSIIDFKTAMKPKRKAWINNYFMQEAAYAIMFEERTGLPITQLVTIISVDGANEPQIFVEHRDNWVRPLRETIAKYNKEQESTCVLL